MIGFGEDWLKEWVWMKTYLPTADVKSYFRGWTLKPKPTFSGGEKVRIAESETSSSKVLLLPSRQLAYSIITTSRPAISAEVHFQNWLVNFLCNLSLLWTGLPSHSLLCATAVLEIPREQVFNFHGNLDSRSIYLVAGAGCWKHCKRCDIGHCGHDHHGGHG